MDWIFRGEDYTCDFRAAGVLVKDGRIFVQRERDGNEYALPGGHVKIGEESAESLRREFLEEAGVDICVGRLLWTEECFWEWKGKKAHNISFYYRVELCEGEVIPEGFLPQGDNENVVMGWMDIDEIKSVTIYPEFLKEMIFDMDAPARHFVTRA